MSKPENRQALTALVGPPPGFTSIPFYWCVPLPMSYTTTQKRSFGSRD
jgi:hypothetical protein